jgi:4-hydroxybenzoate polyprenyltransferase
MRLLRVVRVIHPFPTLLNVVATAGLALVAARGMPDASLLARMLALMFCAQSAIGIVNDLCDRELDAATKPWKPIADGLIPQPLAVAAATLLVASTIGVGVTLGIASFALAMLGLAAGLAYDLRLKRSAFSALPYMIGIPTLPLWVWATLGEWQPALWWLVPIGGLIGLSLQLQNSLADLDDDASQGVFGLAYRLGARRTIIVAWSSFAGALAASALLAPALDYDVIAYISAAGVAAMCFGLTIAAYALRRDSMSLQIGFGLLGIGAAVLATGWLAAVT